MNAPLCDQKSAADSRFSVSLSETERVVLRAVVAEPGERTVAQLASELHLQKAEVARAVHRMSRRGLLAARLYRRHAHARLSGLETPMERHILLLTQSVRLTKRQLAVALEVRESSGGLSAALRRLHRWGQLSLPTEIWPSPLGLQLAAELEDADG